MKVWRAYFSQNTREAFHKRHQHAGDSFRRDCDWWFEEKNQRSGGRNFCERDESNRRKSSVKSSLFISSFFFCLAGLFIRTKVVKCPQSALRAFWRFVGKLMLMYDSALCMRVALFVSLKSHRSVINEELASDATKRWITAQEQGEKKPNNIRLKNHLQKL